MSRLKIVTSPWEFWRLKLEAKISRNSGCWNISTDSTKMTRIKIQDYNYLYLSPRGKNKLGNLAGLHFGSGEEISLSNWVKEVLDDIDTKLGRWITKVQTNVKKVKESLSSHRPEPVPAFQSTPFNPFNGETITKSADRRKYFNSIKKGSLAGRIDKFDSASYNASSITTESFVNGWRSNQSIADVLYGGISMPKNEGKKNDHSD